MASFLIFLLGLGLIFFGARLFLGAAVYLAKLLRFPEIIVGATVVSLATTLPETLVSIFSSSSFHTQLALGNVIGSGIVNLGLLMGIILLGHGEEVGKGRGRRRSIILFGLVLFVYLWFLFFGEINFWGGTILIFLAVGYLIYSLRSAVKESGDGLVFIETALESHLLVIAKFLAGIVLLIVGARFLVDNGVIMAKTFDISEALIGLTMIAVGTSIPELATVVTGLLTGHSRISLGNLTGATVLTFTLALGVAAIIEPVSVPAGMMRVEFPLLLAFSVISILFALFSKIPARLLGAFLFLSYFFYLFASFSFGN